MDGAWMSYHEAAAKLGTSIGGIRKRAARGHWARQAGNDGKARVLVPDGTSMGRPTPVRVDVTALRADVASTVSALQEHIATLKAELAASETRVDKLSTQLAQRDEALAAARAASDKATADLVTLARRLASIAEARVGNPARGENKFSKNNVAELPASENPELALRLAAAIAEASASNVAEGQNKASKNSGVEVPPASFDAPEPPRRLAAIAEASAENSADGKNKASESSVAEVPAAENSAPEPPRRSRAGRVWSWFLRN